MGYTRLEYLEAALELLCKDRSILLRTRRRLQDVQATSMLYPVEREGPALVAAPVQPPSTVTEVRCWCCGDPVEIERKFLGIEGARYVCADCEGASSVAWGRAASFEELREHYYDQAGIRRKGVERWRPERA